MGTDITSPTFSPLSILDDHPASAPAEATDAREAAAVRAPDDGAPVREAAVPVPEADPGPEPVLPPADQPVALQAEAARRRIDSLLSRASAGMPCLNGSLYETLRTAVPRPGLFRTGHCMHTKVADAARACDKAAAEFGTIAAAKFAERPLPKDTLASLKAFTDAQQNFAAALQHYSEKTGTQSAEISNLIQSANNRAAEALNLVAVMQIAGMNQAPAEGEGAAVAAALAEGRLRVDRNAPAAGQLLGVGAQMHGAHFSHPLIAGLGNLSARLDGLEARINLMTATEFRQEAGAVRADIDQLRGEIAGIGDAPGGLGDNMTVARDAGLQQQLERVLAGISGRFETIAGSRTTVRNAVTVFLPEMDGGAFNAFAEAPFDVLGNLPGTLAEAVRTYSAERGAILENLDRGQLTDRTLEENLNTATRRITDLKSEVALFRILHLVATNPQFGAYQLLQLCEKDPLDLHLTMKQAEKMTFRLKAMAAEGHPAIRQAEVLASSFAAVRSSFVEADINEIKTMLGRERANAASFRAGYLAAAFEHHVDAATLIGAAQRGIPADQLELSVGDGNLVKDRILGQGAANAVSLCTYLDDDGQTREFVFKPELGARYGLTGLRACEVGYDPAVRVMQVNVAATRVADAIGSGGTVARSTIGTHRGQIGLFMERAPGRTARDFIHSGALIDTLKAARKAGTLTILRANLMRELCRLEWADVLAGQVDRHGDNYLVDINPANGSVRITGIDNDASFGTRRQGIDAYDVTGIDGYQKGDVVRLREQGDEVLLKLRSAFGLNQMSVPTHIDQTTYDRLMAVRSEEYRASLASCLSPEAVDAAHSRLLEAKNYAEQLRANDRVVADWTNVGVLNQMRAERRNPQKQRDPLAYTMNGFFSRDFLPFFC